jgi:hypothetical protein
MVDTKAITSTGEITETVHRKSDTSGQALTGNRIPGVMIQEVLLQEVMLQKVMNREVSIHATIRGEKCITRDSQSFSFQWTFQWT